MMQNRLFRLFPFLCVSWAFACGPWIPEPYLTRNDSLFYAPPEVGFSAELAHILPDSAPHEGVFPEEGDELVAAQDVEDALGGGELGAAMAAEYLSLSEALRTTNALDEIRFPDALPVEFRYYLEGARSYHLGDIEGARLSWKILLALPEEQRRYRSTWAAFMLAKTAEDDAIPAAYQRVRELAAADFVDSTGLAASSYGWEARHYLHEGNYADAIDLYVKQWGAGYYNALKSLEMTAAAAFEELSSSEHMEPLAADPNARAVLTAYLLDAIDNECSQAQRLVWLQALPEANELTLKEAGRFALMEYQLNRIEACRRWLGYASGDDALALWISSKLMLRDGKIVEGQTLMLALAKQMQTDQQNPDWQRIDTGQAWAELGLLLLGQERYGEAASAFYNSGSWEDIAYILERLLTTDELLAWLQDHPVQVADENNHVQGSGVHVLAARRLMREAKFDLALGLFDAETQQLAERYIGLMKKAHDADLPSESRAQHFWKVACLVRESGMQLFGAELAPDYVWFDGAFPQSYFDDLPMLREKRRYGWQEGYELNEASWGETRRAEKTQAQPKKRYHYIYRAVTLAEFATALLPNDSEDAAWIYLRAGTWLKYRDPYAADRLYKLLVLRCPNTTFGRKAAKLNWFPKIDNSKPNLGPYWEDAILETDD